VTAGKSLHHWTLCSGWY